MVVSAAQNAIFRSRSLMQRNVSAPGGGELEEAKFSQAHTSSLGSLSGRVIRERTVLSLFKYLMLKFSGFVSCCLFFVDLSFFYVLCGYQTRGLSGCFGSPPVCGHMTWPQKREKLEDGAMHTSCKQNVHAGPRAKRGIAFYLMAKPAVGVLEVFFIYLPPDVVRAWVKRE